MGFVVLGVVLVVVLGVSIRAYNRKKRREYLMGKYHDLELVELIMKKKIRQGMTKEQLVDSWGEPVDTDEKVYKTKIKETFKYNQSGKNRFRERVFVEDGYVVGWQEKG